MCGNADSRFHEEARGLCLSIMMPGEIVFLRGWLRFVRKVKLVGVGFGVSGCGLT
jgi:hypothetical protein